MLGGGDSNTPTSIVGSAYLNDVYLRSKGKRVSQMTADSGSICGHPVIFKGAYQWSTLCVGAIPFYQACPAGYAVQLMDSFGDGVIFIKVGLAPKTNAFG
jgi:hypothetical protein